MKPARIIFLLIGSLIACASLGSCFLIGAGIGAAIDNRNSRDTTREFQMPLFKSMHRGAFAKIEYTDGIIQYATFEDYTQEPDSSYLARFDLFSKNHVSRIPFSLGDSIEVVNHWGKRRTGRFNGYTPALSITIDSINNLNAPISLSRKELLMRIEKNEIPIRGYLHFKTYTYHEYYTEKNEKPFILTNSDFKNVRLLELHATEDWMNIGLGIDGIIFR